MGTRQRLTLSGPAFAPEWSPDGRRLTFGFQPSASWDVHAAPADGSGAGEALVTTPQTEFPIGWSPQGVFAFWRQTTRGDILYLDGADGAERAFAASAAGETAAALSPDGRWLAYVSDESGQREVYVRPFPRGDGRWQLSRDGGVEPRWSWNGREIIYRDGEWFLAVPVVPGPAFGVGRVDSLFRGAFLLSGIRAQYDVSRDGSEVLVVGAAAESRTLSVTLDAFSGLLDDRRRSVGP